MILVEDYVADKIDLENRLLFIDSELDNVAIGMYIRALQRMASTNKKPITLYITSPGGEIHNGLALYDTLEEIRNSGIFITTIATGEVASMAFIVYLAGNRRICLPRSSFMNHKGDAGFGGNDDEVVLEAKEIKRIEKLCNQIVADRTKYRTAAWWNNHIRKGVQYYDKTKALKLGITTE